MKKLITIFLVILMGLISYAQNKISFIVLPSENWCKKNGFVSKVEVQGGVIDIPNYEYAMQNSEECKFVVECFNKLLIKEGCQIKDISDELCRIDSMLKTCSSIECLPHNILKHQGIDVYIELDWKENVDKYNRHSITYIFEAFDANSDKKVAYCQGSTMGMFRGSNLQSLEETVYSNFDYFKMQLNNHLIDINVNGREVTLDIKVLPNDLGISLNRPILGEDSLIDVIENWILKKTISKEYKLFEEKENYVVLEQIRIPCFCEDNSLNTVQRLAEELAAFLFSEYQLPCKIGINYLGKTVITIG